MCLSIGRVFADGFPTTSTSFVDAAIEWCASQGSKVINLSLGGVGSPNQSSQDILDALWEEGVLVVAAAGNEANTQKSYPASYEHVLSVAAVDELNRHASFSQRNDAVDISAPGVQVLSTVGGVLAMVLLLSSETTTDERVVVVSDLNERRMSFAPFIDPTVDEDIVQESLEIVDCQEGFDVCGGVENRACLIERGTTFFWEKALNCQAGGGILVLIYSNVDGIFLGTLGDDSTGVEIPVLSLTRSEGQDLLSQDGSSSSSGVVAVVSVVPANSGYSFFSGTSMASPHVVGVAARIWAARSDCTNAQVQDAMLTTALDLGPTAGRDDLYGYGLVQALDAYNYLLSLDEPCGLVGASTPTTDLPTFQPTEAATTTCDGLFTGCTSDSDCCSNLCRASSADGPRQCRAEPKGAKTKISGARGGSAFGGRRVLRGSAKTNNNNATFGSSIAAKGEEIPEVADSKVESNNQPGHLRVLL
jgi:serine protease